MKLFDWIVFALLIVCIVVMVISMTGCSMQAAFSMKCKGECEIEVERGIDVKAPSPVPLSLEPK